MAVVQWLDDRYPFTKAVDESLYQRVPNFANAFYYCFGEYDGVIILEAPNAIAAAAGSVAGVSAGHLKVNRTTVLLTAEETVEAMRKAGETTFRRPT